MSASARRRFPLAALPQQRSIKHGRRRVALLSCQFGVSRKFAAFAMDGDGPMKLHVWEGDYGLVSMSVPCVQVILYAKIANVPVEVVPRTNPYVLLASDLPVFKHKRTNLSKPEEIFNHFRRLNYGADYMLTKKECSSAHAYSHMVVRNLKPVLEFVLWANVKNFEELTRVWYSRAMYLPFNIIYTTRRRKRSLSMMEALYPCDDNLIVMEKYLMKQIGDTLTTVSNHIGQGEYFFGSFPSSIDALIYSHLAPLIKIPFPSKEIPNLVKSFTNLVRYVRNIDQKYFPEVSPEVRYLKKEEDLKKLSEDEFHTSVKTKLLTFSFVFLAMFSYAASNNIIDMYKVRHFFTG